MSPGIDVERTNTGIGRDLTPAQTLAATPSTVSSMADTNINLVFLMGNISAAMLTYSYGLAPSLAALRFNRSLINLFVLTPSHTFSTSLTTTKGSASLAISSSSSNSTSGDSMTHSATARGKSLTFTNASTASHSAATQTSVNTASLSRTPSITMRTSLTNTTSASMSFTFSVTTSNPLTWSPLWLSRSLSSSDSESLLPSASCNPDPVNLRYAFLTSGQSVPSLVRALPSSSIIEGATFPSLSIPSNVAEGIQQSETAPQSSLNVTIHIVADNAALNLAVVLYQMKIITLTIQNLARSEEPCYNCTTVLMSADCEWDAFAPPVAAPPFIVCRVFNVATAANRFADVRLLISLVVGCDRPRSTIPVLVTLEARPLPLADIAQVISQTSLVVSVLTGNSVVGALAARSRATLRVLSCANPGSDGAGNGGLFGLELGDGALAASRGAIASTAIVVAFAYVGALGVAVVLGCIQLSKTSLRERLAQLHVLSYPVVLFLLCCPTVIAAAMSLVAYDVATSADLIIGAVSLLMISLTLMYSLWHVLWIAPTKFYARPVEEGGHQEVLTGRWYFLRSMLQRVLKKHYRWTPREITATVDSTGNNGTARRYGITPLIDDYRILWFFIFELVSNLLSGAVAGVPGLDKSDDASQSLFACMGLTAILLTCYLLQLGACVVFRPLSSIFMHVYTVHTLALSCAMCASVVAFLVFVNTANNAAVASPEKALNTDHASTATLCAVYFSILIGASTIVKAAMDGWSILCFLWHLLFHRRRIEELPPPTTVSLLNSALQSKEDIYIDDVRQDEFMGILINTFAANVEEVDEVAIAELHPTEECENVFGMESTSTDPLRELLILHQAQGEELCSAATIVE